MSNQQPERQPETPPGTVMPGAPVEPVTDPVDEQADADEEEHANGKPKVKGGHKTASKK